MSFYNISEASDYSGVFLQQVERDCFGLSSESIRAFSMVLNMSTDSLLFGNSTESFECIAEKLKAVPPEKREYIMRLIDNAIECAK